MIIKAKHNFFIFNFFTKYSIRKIQKTFNTININGQYKDNGKPLLVIANHISWWDGFWVMYLNKSKINKKFHFMMLEEQLKKFWFFKYCGGFSINKKSRTVIDTLNYTSELLQNKNNMVLIFPQGEIKSIYEQSINFEKGVEWLVRKNKEIQVMKVVNIVDYFSHPKPSLYIYHEEYILKPNISTEQEYQQFYSETIKNHIKRTH